MGLWPFPPAVRRNITQPTRVAGFHWAEWDAQNAIRILCKIVYSYPTDFFFPSNQGYQPISIFSIPICFPDESMHPIWLSQVSVVYSLQDFRIHL